MAPSSTSGALIDLMEHVQAALALAHQEPTLKILRAYGLSEAYMNEGRGLRDALQDAWNAHTDARSDLRLHRDRVRKAHKAAHRQYARDLDLLRALVPTEDAAYARLGLRGRRDWGRRSGWTAQARATYTALQEAEGLPASLQAFPLDPAKGLALVTALDDAVAAREEAMLRVRRCKQARDQAEAALSNYLSTFYVVTDQALEDVTGPSIREMVMRGGG